MDPAKPENTPFKSAAEALASFKDNREKLIDYTKNTDADLRNHIVMGIALWRNRRLPVYFIYFCA